jgi:hypothetical protein
MDRGTGFGTAEGTGLGPDSGKWIRIIPGVVKAELGSGSRLLVVVLSSSSKKIRLKNKVFGSVLTIKGWSDPNYFVDTLAEPVPQSNKRMVRIRTISKIP